MTSTVLRRLVATLIPLTLLGTGIAVAWLARDQTIASTLYFVAVLATFRAPLRQLTIAVATIGTISSAAAVHFTTYVPTIDVLAWLGGTWLAALFIWKQTQSPLVDAAELTAVLQKARTGLLVADLSGRVIGANEKIGRIFQQDPQRLQGLALATLLGDELWQMLAGQCGTAGDAASGGTAPEIEFELHRESGAVRALACRAKLARDHAARPTSYVVEITDLSAERAARRALQTAADQLRRMLARSSDLVLFTDAKLTITYANDNARNALRAGGGDPVGQPVYRFIKTPDRRKFMKTMEQFAQKSRNEAALPRLTLADSENTPVSTHIVRLTEPDNIGYAVIFGIAEHHLQALADSKSSQAPFYQVFHGTPDAILLMQAADGLVLDFNEGFTRLLGYSREDAIGAHDLHLQIWANASERDAVIERMSQEREVIDYETTLKTRDGALVHVEISLRYVQIDDQLSILCIGRDITKRVSAEAALVESEEKFGKVFSQSPDGILILRKSDGVITDLNQAILSRSNYDRDEVVGRSIYTFPEFIDTGDARLATDELATESTFANRAVTFHAKNGDSIPSLISAIVMELSGEAFIMVMAKDISKQRATEERLRLSEERFRGIFENTPIGILLIDMQGRIFQANHTAAELLAYNEPDMSGIHISRLVPAEDRQSLKTSLSGLTVKQSVTHRSERRMICQNGLEIWTNFHVVLQQSEAGDALSYIVQIADITDIKRSQQRMEQMAFYDTLTNLANRRLFHERLEHAIEHCVRSGRASALLYLDLDNFKRVNDTLGHQVGDHLLREVATRLQTCVRKEDTVGRTGGDEFTILLAEIASPTDAGMVAQKILNHLREPIHVSGHPLIVTTSIGITVLPGDALDPNALMRNADLAMYKAKERGRNNYQFYSEDLNTNAIQRLRTEYEIRQALDRHEFELYYQPKVSLQTRQIVGVESLIRWNHPERGVLTPDEFIEVAEDTGSIIDIGTWVIEEACRACRVLTEQHGQPFQVAINISPRQFRDPNLVATMRRSLRQTDLNAQNIEIEITETMLMQDVEAAQTTIGHLSALGVSLAIDDFGTGYSSLNYLKRFPINTVKVDRSFVTDLPSNADDMAITRAVIAMAHQLKMEVVAEGVETMAQLEFLTEQKCEYAQGWLFSKALPLDEVVRLLADDLGMINIG